jgi:hypothetical protein
MSKENFQYDGLLGLTFIDEDGNEMPAADAMNLRKADSNDERDAARQRWAEQQES